MAVNSDIRLHMGVFWLAYKTRKAEAGPQGIIQTYKLVFKDDLGNQITVRASESQFNKYIPGDSLDLDRVLRQTAL